MDLNHRLAYSPRLYPHTLPPELMRSHIKERYRVLLTASSLRLSCVHRGMRVKHMPHFRPLYRSSLSYPTHIGFEPMTQVFNLLRLSYGLSNWPLYQCKRQVCDPDGTRTHDSHIKSVVLYQLSYGVIKRENGLTVKEWSEDTHIPLLWGLFTALHQANILPIIQISHVFLRHCYVFKTLYTYPICSLIPSQRAHSVI